MKICNSFFCGRKLRR